MKWIYDYQLFLFDLDGLLVNTEEIHYLAYQRMCASHGFKLDWDFNRYCQAAHYHQEGLRDQIYTEFPALKAKEPSWNILYEQKKQAMVDLYSEGAIHMMPGAQKLLEMLNKSKIKRCVVTHSSDDLVKAIRKQNPILDTIPVWFTRENYTHPKPHPECYLNAIEKLAAKNDQVIGFEDTPRGLKALMGTRAQPVLISQIPYPEIPSFLQVGVWHYPSFSSMEEEG
jgi:beta-phosphoglucomutase